MAVQLIPNQLVKLYDTETFNQRNKRLTLDYRTYCQIVREEQTTMFQLKLLPDSVNLLTNGDFVNNISSWNVAITKWQWASGRLQGIKNTVSNAIIFQQVTVTPGKAYQLNLSAQFAVSDTAQLTVILRDATNTLITTQIFRAEDLGSQPFDIEMFLDAQASTSIFVTFLLAGNIDDLVYIDDVSLYELTEPVVTLETCEGATVKTIPVFARSGNIINYAVEWFGLDEGCYRVCIEGVDNTEFNYLDDALALETEGGQPIELEQGGYLQWYG